MKTQGRPRTKSLKFLSPPPQTKTFSKSQKKHQKRSPNRAQSDAQNSSLFQIRVQSNTNTYRPKAGENPSSNRQLQREHGDRGPRFGTVCCHAPVIVSVLHEVWLIKDSRTAYPEHERRSEASDVTVGRHRKTPGRRNGQRFDQDCTASNILEERACFKLSTL